MRPFEIKPLQPIRSVADALEEVRAAGLLREGERAQFRTTCIRFPERGVIGFVVLAGPEKGDGVEWYLPMPSSRGFTAKTPLGDRVDYPIYMLNRAAVGCGGEVRLETGEELRALDFITASASYELSGRDDAIVWLTLAFLDKLDECWPHIYGEVFPGPRALRYDKISKIRVKDLKLIHHYVNERLRGPVSLSVVSKALARAGMQMPRSQRAHHGIAA
jgi:hypothetical protein